MCKLKAYVYGLPPQNQVEFVISEHDVLAANQLNEHSCELVVTKFSVIAKQRECSSMQFATPRCSKILELVVVRDASEKKYEKYFVSTDTDLRPSCEVNPMLIDKLPVDTPIGDENFNNVLALMIKGRILYNAIMSLVMKHQTLVLCTHNVQAISSADMIIVMEKGHVKWVKRFK